MAEEEERRLLIAESAVCLRFVVEEERLSIGPTDTQTRVAKLVEKNTTQDHIGVKIKKK